MQNTIFDISLNIIFSLQKISQNLIKQYGRKKMGTNKLKTLMNLPNTYSEKQLNIKY